MLFAKFEIKLYIHELLINCKQNRAEKIGECL